MFGWVNTAIKLVIVAKVIVYSGRIHGASINNYSSTNLLDTEQWLSNRAKHDMPM